MTSADLSSPDPEAIYDVLIDLGKRGAVDRRQEVESFLSSDTPFLREAAIKVLAFHWRLDDHEATATRLVVEDPDPDVRAAAAMALGKYAQGDSDILRSLVAICLNPNEDEAVRDAAFTAAQVVAGVSREDYPIKRTLPGFELRADWDLLERLLARCGAPIPDRLREMTHR